MHLLKGKSGQARKLRTRSGKTGAAILAVSAQKGGVGKTTSAVHVAWDLASHYHRKTLLIDLDAQGHVGTHLAKYARIETTKNLGNVLMERHGNIADIVVPTGVKDLHLTCSDKNLHQIEIQLNGKIGKEMILRRALEHARENFDVIVLDCPPNLGNLTVSALVACDSVLVPTDLSRLSLEGVSDILHTLETIDDTFGNAPFLEGVLLTRVDRRSKRYNEEVRETLRALVGEKLLDTEIPAQSSVARAQAEGTTVFDLDPSGAAAIAYEKLTQKLTQSLGIRTLSSNRRSA